MARIMIQCPVTLLDVSVGIETDRESFEALPNIASSMNCPACGEVHPWSPNWAWVEPLAEGARRRPMPARLKAS